MYGSVVEERNCGTTKPPDSTLIVNFTIPYYYGPRMPLYAKARRLSNIYITWDRTILPTTAHKQPEPMKQLKYGFLFKDPQGCRNQRNNPYPKGPSTQLSHTLKNSNLHNYYPKPEYLIFVSFGPLGSQPDNHLLPSTQTHIRPDAMNTLVHSLNSEP